MTMPTAILAALATQALPAPGAAVTTTPASDMASFAAIVARACRRSAR
jgi:hypothetical protein